MEENHQLLWKKMLAHGQAMQEDFWESRRAPPHPKMGA